MLPIVNPASGTLNHQITVSGVSPANEKSTPNQARLTVVEKVYHQCGKDQPTVVENGFNCIVDSDEQVYQRHTVVGETWTPIDIGWIKKASHLIVKNGESPTTQGVLSPEQKQQLAKKVLELAMLPSDGGKPVPFCLIPVYPSSQESVRLRPTDIIQYLIRSQSGNCRYTITLIPG